MEKQFNQKDYIAEYDKTHYKQFKAKLKTEEMNEINNLLKQNNINKTDFIKLAKWALNTKEIYMKYKSEKK